MTFDAHCDTITVLRDKGLSIAKNDRQIDMVRLKALAGHVQCFAIFLHEEYRQDAYKNTVSYIDFFYEEIGKHPNDICAVATVSELREAVEQSKTAAILTIEGGDSLEGDMDNLTRLYQKGVRMMTLTWNHANEIASGCKAEDGVSCGLTEFGVNVVEEMNRMGIIVDVSHLNDKGFWDVVDVCREPFVASHSNARAICDVPRNLTDIQIRAIAEKGGLIGINFYDAFITKNSDCGLDDLMLHVEHIINKGGEDCIGLGSDYDGIATVCRGMEDVSRLPVLGELVAKKYNSSIAEKMLFKNGLRVINDTWK